jgi:hypothetical protein
MKVYLYPADQFGCGHYRMIWPAQYVQKAGLLDVTISAPKERDIRFSMQGDEVVDVDIPEDADVVVFQRTTHRLLAQGIRHMRKKGVAVVIDVDDDLTRIHPTNPAFQALHPGGGAGMHGWQHLGGACKEATLVTVSTQALVPRYAVHGRARVLENRIPDQFLDPPHEDSNVISWAASVASHPDDGYVVGPAVSRLIREGYPYFHIAAPDFVQQVLKLPEEPPGCGPVDVFDWIPTIAKHAGIGMAPLADTQFNAAKSWLKPLEYSACGIPWVASPRAEYTRLHKLAKKFYGDAVPGFLADKPQVWYRQLKRLADDAGLREECAKVGRQLAYDTRMSTYAEAWAEAWQAAYDIEHQ